MTVRARELLLHPIALIAVAVLVANDHWLKAAHPSWLTGKLSDAAGLAVFPLLVLVVVERWAPRTWPSVVGAIVVTALGFALVKTWPPATEAYRVGLGVLQWAFRAGWAIAQGAPIGGPATVEAVVDPSDLLTLPFSALAALVARSGGYLGGAADSCYNRQLCSGPYSSRSA